jgi:ParB-like chromosome segregation protein Spo0J
MPAPPAFQLETITLRPDQLVPRKHLSPNLKHTVKYRQIKASIVAVGLIEPLNVYPRKDGKYMILDGHVRAAILSELKVLEVECTVATEEEAYTYNKRINALSTIQEHQMVLKALKNGLSEERIAKALDLRLGDIRQKRDLVNGISDEVVELLKNRHIAVDTFKTLKKMAPYRQLEATELMISASNFSASFAKAIYAGSKPEDLLKAKKERVDGFSKEQMANMEEEINVLHNDLAAVRDSYAHDMLTLSISIKYLTSLVTNRRVLSYLSNKHPDLLRELQDAIQKPTE